MKQGGVVLIIDDDEDYSCLLQIALREAGVTNPIRIIQDSAAAVTYLKGALSGDPQEEPALVLLDLRMPKVSGVEVLDRIRKEPGSADLPIAVFTGVESLDEQSRAVASGASSLRVKPFTYRELVDAARSLHEEYLVNHEYQRAA